MIDNALMKKRFLIGAILLALIFLGVFAFFNLNDSSQDKDQGGRWEKSGPPSKILYQKTVKWGGFMEGVGPTLENDNFIVIGKSELPIEVIHEWESGKSLTLAYSRAKGVFLVEPTSGKKVQLRYLKSDHPIDGYLNQELNNPEGFSTQGMVEAYDRAIDLWNLELKRFDDDVLSRKYFRGEIRDNYLKLQKIRTEYLESIFTAKALAVYFAPDGGTVRQVDTSSIGYSITRDIVLHTLEMAKYVEDFDSPGQE